MAKLDGARIHELYAAVVSAQLVRCRGQLLAGVADALVRDDHVETSLQILADLDRMNAAREPLRRRALATWLRNAVALAGSRRTEAEIFTNALARLSGHEAAGGAEGDGSWLDVAVTIVEIYVSRGVSYVVLRYVVDGVEHLVSRRDPDAAWRVGHALGGHYWSDDATALSFAFDPPPTRDQR